MWLFYYSPKALAPRPTAGQRGRAHRPMVPAMGPKRLVGLVGVVVCLLVVGRALAADGSCPNGLPFCFAADTPAQAAQVNQNFAQLKEWLEAKVGAVGAGVTIAGPMTVSGTLSAGGLSTTGAVSAGSLSASGAASVGAGLTVTGGVGVTGNVVASGNVMGAGLQVSCGKASAGNGFQFCCRINQRTGGTDCRQYTSGGSWVVVAAPFSAGADGLYGLSCVGGEPGTHFPYCCRINVLNGATACMGASGWGLASWGPWPSPY